MNERSNKGNEFFRTSEYNTIAEGSSTRNIASVYDCLTSLEYDESTHRKNSYSSSINTSRREQQKATAKTAVLATAGTVSIIAVIAAIAAVIVGISFLSFNASLTELSCIVDIPEDMEGDFVGVLYDAEGNEVAETQVSGAGKCTFSFTGLFPETQYYFSVFDAEGTQYLYETVKTSAGTIPLIITSAEEYFPFAVRLSLKVYNPVQTSFEVTLTYDESTGNEISEKFPLPDDGVITARKEFAENVRITISDADGTVYFDSNYALSYIDYEITEDVVQVEESSVSFSVNIDNPSGFSLTALLIESGSGDVIASAPLSNGLNELTFNDVAPGVYEAYIEDGLGERYEIGIYYAGAQSR